MHHKWREEARIELRAQRCCSLPGSCNCCHLLQTYREEGTDDQGGQAPANVALHRLLGAQHDQRRGADEEAGHVGHDVVDGDDGHREDVPHHAVTEGQVQEVACPDKIEHGEMGQAFGRMYS